MNDKLILKNPNYTDTTSDRELLEILNDIYNNKDFISSYERYILKRISQSTSYSEIIEFEIRKNKFKF